MPLQIHLKFHGYHDYDDYDDNDYNYDGNDYDYDVMFMMITMIMITSACHWLPLQIHLEFNVYHDYDDYDDYDDNDYECMPLVALANQPGIQCLPCL